MEGNETKHSTERNMEPADRGLPSEVITHDEGVENTKICIEEQPIEKASGDDIDRNLKEDSSRGQDCEKTDSRIFPESAKNVTSQTKDDDDNCLTIVRSDVSGKDNSEGDYLSDESKAGIMAGPSIKSTENTDHVPCKRKKLLKYHQKSKKRKFKKTGNLSGPDDLPSTSSTKLGEKPRKLAKIPFRFSPKKSCSGSRFKRKVLDNKRKKLRFKRRKVAMSFDTSDEDDGFGINDELEQTLEKNATKNNLTAINVKSILHHVITNEHVLAMVRNTMLEEEKEQSAKNQCDGEKEEIEESEEALFEPKMTRSKLKKVVEQVGNAPYVWPLSPVKNKNTVPQFAELNFPEDSEDDEDYKPDPNEKDESDHESYLSSQVSDFGSPSPFTPLSQHSFLDKDESPIKNEKKLENKTKDSKVTSKPSQSHFSIKVPPVKPQSSSPQPDKMNADDENFMMLLDEMDKELDSMNQNTHGTDIIAKRTRSKLTIENSLDEIEASFVAPDITADMYDSDCDDNKEWKEWLNDLFKDKKDNELNDTFDDEQNDPDFNFMADEEEVIDTEETRTDRAVRVSKKELNVLLDELLESYGDETNWNEPVEVQAVDPPATLAAMLTQLRSNPMPVTNTPKMAVKVIPIVTPNERLQLQQQMQQHVQLLCQLNLLGRGDFNYNREADQAKMFLNELAMLGGMTQSDGTEDEDTKTQLEPSKSAFITCNLSGALDIVNDWNEDKESGDGQCSTEKNYNFKQVPKDAKITLMSSIVFMYPELLPQHGLKYQPSNKPVFVDSEDHLIVLGLRQFDQFPNKFRLIQKHMIPGKTVKQIQSRIKNFCANKKCNNVIKNYRKHKMIPVSVNPCRPVLPGQEVAPIFQFQEQLPDWMKNLKMSSLMKLERDLEKERKMEERTRKAVLASVEEYTDDKKELPKVKKKAPAPVSSRVNLALPVVPQTPLPVAIVQTVNGSQIIQLVQNPSVPNNSGALPPLINVLPQPVSVTTTQTVAVNQNTQPVVTVMTPPNNPIEINNVTKQNSVELVNSNSANNKNESLSSNQRVMTPTTALTPCSTAQNAAVPNTTTVLSATTAIFKQTPSANNAQVLQNISFGTGLPQPPIIMIPQNLQTQGKFVIQPDNVIVVQRNPVMETISQTVNSTTSSEDIQPSLEVNQNEVSSSLQTSLVPSKSKLIQLSPGKHGPVIKFGGRQSLIKDSNEKSEVKEKSILPSSLKSGISALKGFKIHQNGSDDTELKQEEIVSVETTSPQTIPDSIKVTVTVSSMSVNEDNCSPSIIASSGSGNSDKSFENMDAENSQGDLVNPRILGNHVLETSTYSSRMEPVVHSTCETSQKQPKENLDISKDSGMAVDDSVNQYNEEDDIDVEGVTADDEVIKGSEQGGEKRKTGKEIEDDEDDFDIDVVGVSDSKTDLKDTVTNVVHRSQTKSQEPVTSEDCHDNSPDEGHPAESGVMSEEELKASRKVAAKRLKSRLRKEMESTVVLLDPDIVHNDPKKAERDDVFARAYLNRVKDHYKDRPFKYLEFLQVLGDFDSDDRLLPQCYERLKNVLAGQDELIEDFTAFLDPEQAVRCGVLMSHLEFSKARLFLREIEVHFQKQHGHFQKILKAIVTWGETENRTYQQLKDLLLPLLKGQPHLEQELSGLFPDDRPAENLMPDFEMAEWSEDKEFDGFEEIELPDSEDEEKQMKGKISTVKLDIVDPWQRLNAELQYGTRRCRCSCHDRSLDSRVQKKARHCAYCTAKVSRAELTSSFRGIASVKARASRNTRRKISKSQKGSRHIEAIEDDHDDGNAYSAAVNNLSEMCNNLADYLNENASGEIEEIDEDVVDAEDDVEDDVGDVEDDVGEDDIVDVEDDTVEEDTGDIETEEEDIEEMDIDDDEADEEVQKLIGDGIGLTTSADTASSNSPEAMSSQESKETSESDESNIVSPESKSPIYHPNTLHLKYRNENNSFSVFSSEDGKTEDTKKQCTSSKELNKFNNGEKCTMVEDISLKTGEHRSSGQESPDNLGSANQMKASYKLIDKVSTDQHTSRDSSFTENEISLIDVANVSVSSSDSQTNTYGQSSEDCVSLTSCTNSGINEPSLLPEKKCNTEFCEISKRQLLETGDVQKSVKEPCQTQLSVIHTKLKDCPNKDFETNDSECLTSVQTNLIDAQTDYSKDHHEQIPISSDAHELKGHSKDFNESVVKTRETIKHYTNTSSNSKMSADNIRQTSDGSVIVSWTRDEDRLLLQTCQAMENSRKAFEVVSTKLGSKSVSEVEERFSTLMTLFTKRPKSDGEESADRSDSERSSTSDGDE